ncbi:HBR272Wp [Eremothecium sinecaudum]|uniref:HBR272Wp n=1 Tax=Eremothecium sinecaudum TaxID=45286 RepID=A0A109UX50_9SACH|nr:HBR272Wp [Eremothecium sinecaudum]AMD19173.1 HBR272Wp [Eremothecium sinecaudum]
MQLTEYTNKLLNDPENFTPDDLKEAITILVDQMRTIGLTTVENSIHVSCFLAVLQARNKVYKAEYLVATIEAMRKTANSVKAEDLIIEEGVIYGDIVGTGGDGHNTFNVSTSSCIVAGGIPGLKICKHGSKANTSSSGSGDILTELGYDGSKVVPETVPGLLAKNTFMYILGPSFHPGMACLPELKKIMKIRTIFNIVGPLFHNLEIPMCKVLGVYSKHVAGEYARAASILCSNCRLFIVSADIGIDEVSTEGKTNVWHYHPDRKTIETFVIEPADFGLQEHDINEVVSNSSKKNAETLLRILSGEVEKGDAVYDFILMNTAMIYCLSRDHRNWKEGVEAAETSIKSGAALKALNNAISSLDEIKTP